MNSKNLVIVRAGDSSLHLEWLGSRCSKNFDIWVDYYGSDNGKYQGDSDYYSQTGVVPNIGGFIKSNLGIIRRYESIWFPDDDISCVTETINELFDMFEQHRLLLGQPSLTNDSYASHQITLNVPGSAIRFTNFVEAMVPVFSFEALLKCYPTFSESFSGWGTDLVWPKILGYPKDRIAIIDKVSVKHTRQVGTSERYKLQNIDCVQEMRNMVAKYGIEWPYRAKVYSEIKL